MKLFSIKYKIFLISLLISVLLVSLISAFEIANDITSKKKAVENALADFRENYIDNLAEDVWLLNYPAAIQTAEYALSNPHIDLVAIKDPTGKIIYSSDRPATDNFLSTTYELKRFHNNAFIVFGEVQISGNYPGFWSLFQDRFLDIASANAIFVLVIFCAFYLVINRLILTDIFDAIGFVNRIEPNNQKICAIYQPNRRLLRDELTQLAESLNALVRRVETEFSTRVAIEQELLENNSLLSAVFEGIPDVIVTTDTDNRILSANQALEKTFGYRLEDVHGLDIAVLHQDAPTLPLRNDSGQDVAVGKARTLEFRSQAGKTFQGETIKAPFRSGKREIIGYVWVIRDITERTEFEKRSLQAQKMEAIGSLAGGIAHDFNNILAPILAYAQILKKRIPENSTEAEMLDAIHTAGKRASLLVGQILTFSRDSETRNHPLQFGLVVKEAINLIKSKVPKNVKIVSDLQAYEATILGDPTQAHQVIMNLLTNAIQAIGKNDGSVTVGLETTAAPKDLKNNDNVSSFLCLSVADTGHGIDEQTLKRIFDPYFTTRKMEEGTGLGLATVKKIVSSMNGEIIVESQPGEGTLFKIYLPLLKRPVS